MKPVKRIIKEIILPYAPKSIDKTNQNEGFVISFLYFNNDEKLVVKGRQDLVRAYIEKHFLNRNYLEVKTYWKGKKVDRSSHSIHRVEDGIKCFLRELRYCEWTSYDKENQNIPEHLRKRKLILLTVFIKQPQGKESIQYTKHFRTLPHRWIPEFDGIFQ